MTGDRSVIAAGRAALRAWRRTQFAYRSDPRFSYCVHLPAEVRAGEAPWRLLVAVHGTGRNAMAYRDALAGFADARGYVVLAPLFPVGVLGDYNPDGYKYLGEGGLRYDHLLLGMVEELSRLLEADFERFSLFGFSGGGHFAHRFFYRHPARLRSVSVGAPGGVTLLDETRDFWIGTRDFAARFGAAPDVADMRDVPAQIVVGSEDTAEFVYPAHLSQHAPDMVSLGRNRLERSATLLANWRDHGLQARRDVVPGVAHEGLKTISALEAFLAELPPE
jgi:pimeloyl-ACP methyl ester carboxylesterase